MKKIEWEDRRVELMERYERYIEKWKKSKDPFDLEMISLIMLQLNSGDRAQIEEKEKSYTYHRYV